MIIIMNHNGSLHNLKLRKLIFIIGLNGFDVILVIIFQAYEIPLYLVDEAGSCFYAQLLQLVLLTIVT